MKERQLECPRSILMTGSCLKSKDANGHTVLNNKYLMLHKLGQGSQAKVKLAMLINDSFDEDYVPQYFAIKIFLKPYLQKQRSFNRSCSTSSSNGSRRRFAFTTALDEVYSEIEVMKVIDSDNIIKLYEVIDDPSSDKLYLVMPVADYGECLEWSEDKYSFVPNHKLLAKNNTKVLKQQPGDAAYYSEDFIKQTARSLLNAVDYLHTKLNIVHRDIKPANILMDEAGSPLLVDFGKARQLQSNEEDLTTSIQGTYTFLPPECCSFDTDIYSMKKADIWALGMTIYCLTFNKLPYQLGNTEIELMENICNFDLSFEGTEISDELQLFFRAILQKDPNNRASLKELINSPFLYEDTPSLQENNSDQGITLKPQKCLEKLTIQRCNFGGSPLKSSEQ